MSVTEDVATDTAPMNDAKSTGRWVWGSLGAACLLWVVAACTPWLNNWLGSRGQVGDFLGGVSAPVFGFVGMVLVYRSFQAQVKANQLQIEALKAEQEAREADRELQIEALKVERESRREDDEEKAVEDAVKRLNGILDHACYERRHEEPQHVFNGVTAIFHFCKDMGHDTRAGIVFERNAVLPDVIHLWLFEATSALRWASDAGSDRFEELKAHVYPLYAFAISKSLNTLVEKSGFVGGTASEAINRVAKAKKAFDRALEGNFELEESA